MAETSNKDSLAVILLGEIAVVEQLAQSQMKKALPKGMEVSHFAVLNHFARLGGEKTPGQLAKAFHVTKGAMTNTITRLQKAGFVNVRPDWDDARSKRVSLSEAGRRARDEAVKDIEPVFSEISEEIGADRIKAVLPVLRNLRELMDAAD